MGIKVSRFYRRREVGMDQLPSEVLEDIINRIPVKNQLAIRSVNKRFNELALTGTTVLDLDVIPRDRWLQVAEQMPKLTTITNISPMWNSHVMAFVKELATINKNMVNFVMENTDDPPFWVFHCYVESVKELDSSYTGSGLKVIFEVEDYKILLNKFPDLDIKCELRFDGSGPSVGEFLDNEEKTFNFSHVAKLYLIVGHGSDHRVEELLKKTINLKELGFRANINSQSIQFYRLLDAIAQVPSLKKLYLRVTNFEEENDGEEPTFEKLMDVIIRELYLFRFTNDEEEKDGEEPIVDDEKQEENKYIMTDDDYSSLQKVMSIPTLKNVKLLFDFTIDLQNIYDCFIASTNNNFDNLEVSILIYQDLFSSRRLGFECPKGTKYPHQVHEGSLREFSIEDFVRKFSNSRKRRFEVFIETIEYDNYNLITQKWNRIRSEFDQFIQLHPFQSHHKYVLYRATYKG